MKTFAVTYNLKWQTEGRIIRLKTTYGLKRNVQAESAEEAIRALRANVMDVGWNKDFAVTSVVETQEAATLRLVAGTLEYNWKGTWTECQLRRTTI